MLLTEDDLLWYRLKPSPDADLDFRRADRIIAYAEDNRQLVVGAHLVWDQGFGPGWPRGVLWDLDRGTARRLLFGTVARVVRRYRGRVAIWSVVNEAISSRGGLRRDVPWYASIGPGYVAEAFHVAHEADPGACVMLNDFGFETRAGAGVSPALRRTAALRVVDDLMRAGAPLNAFGLQAHLVARDFAREFDPSAYTAFVRELTARGLAVMITELDVLDDGLPADIATRDAGVADVYRRYLDVVLAESAVGCVMNFGLSDRYTWLDQDDQRADGAPRRPLPFDRRLRPTRSYHAIRDAFDAAVERPVEMFQTSGPR